MDQLRIIDFGLSSTFQPDDKKATLTDQVGTASFMAPEILTQDLYDEKVDLWALGVITYLLFSKGKYPFDGVSESLVYKNAKRGKFYLPPVPEPAHDRSSAKKRAVKVRAGGFDWETMMSAEAKDFIKQLLQVNPTQRLSASQALRHPWLNFES